MSTNTELHPSTPPASRPAGRAFLSWPGTRLGWWSVGLSAAFVVMMLINGAVFMQMPEHAAWRPLLILYGWAMIACGLASGITALLALLRRRERSGLVWLPLLAGLFVIVLVLGEFLGPPH